MKRKRGDKLTFDDPGTGPFRFTGTYRSLGYEGRPEDDPDHIPDEEYKAQERDRDDWINNPDRRDPVPVLRTRPVGETEGPREIWRREKEFLGMKKGGVVGNPFASGGPVLPRSGSYLKGRNKP